MGLRGSSLWRSTHEMSSGPTFSNLGCSTALSDIPMPAYGEGWSIFPSMRITPLCV